MTDESKLNTLMTLIKQLFVSHTSNADVHTSSAEKEKLAGVEDGANKYTHPSATAYSSGLYKITTNNTGHVTGATAVTKSDITALGIPASDTNTTYSDMKGATTSAAGTHGLVPAPTSGDSTRYLRSDGTWQVPPNTNTWRGVQDNLTSTSTSDSLSANQGKVLKGLVDDKADSSHTHTKSQITDFPTSLPASDVYSWAKASSKPSYTKSEVDLGNVDNTADSAKSVKYATTAGSVSEANLTWGGKNFSGGYGCIDAAMVPDLGANRLAFAKAKGITIEYSRDGGTTWTDYGASDDSKLALTSCGTTLLIGKADSTNKATADYKLRITIDTGVAEVYTGLNKFCIYVSTNGSTGSTCTIQKALQSTPTTYVTVVNKVALAGWSGYNIINTSTITTYGNNASTQYGRLRFLFECTGGSTTYNGLSIYRIYGYGGVGWTTPSTMAKTGNIYSYDQNKNVTFPANVKASSFTGTVSGNADTATALTSSAGSLTQPIYFNDGKPVATTYALNKTVPSDAKFTDTVYTHPTTTGNKHIPSGGASGQILRWSADGTAVWGADNNTTYSDATTSANGLMSSTDKSKLDGVAAGANNYSLPTASSSTLGGVKTTSTVTSASGYTPCPIISGVPYFKETNATVIVGAEPTEKINNMVWIEM